MPMATDEVARITAHELAGYLRQEERLVVLDVRRREAWAADPEHIPGAIWLPLEEVPERTQDLPPDTRIVLYCS
jgi:rhodanese-related sulfurtransferase